MEGISSVFPAHAGMIPCIVAGPAVVLRVPRACGDDPKIGVTDYGDNECSPRMRG